MKTVDIQGFVKYNEYEKDIGLDYASHSFISELISKVKYELSGIVYDIDEGLGAKDLVIPRCSLRIYFTKDKCTLEEAMFALDLYLECGETDEEVDDVDAEDEVDDIEAVTFIEDDGTMRGHAQYIGYSEYTITGMRIESLTIGGHDLKTELMSHIDEYMHFVIGV